MPENEPMLQLIQIASRFAAGARPNRHSVSVEIIEPQHTDSSALKPAKRSACRGVCSA